MIANKARSIMKKGHLIVLAALLVAACILGSGCANGRAASSGKAVATRERQPSTRDERAASARDRRMAWWREAKFGMFIHWGTYAVPAGEWKGRKGHGEWIMHTAQIPVNQYELFARQFNPVKFNAREWVGLAKKAGMKYIVITTKHHDGFCLFDSQFTEYDIMDATPFKRDIMKELSDECRRQDIKIGWYYSVMDWHHPDYLPRRKWERRPAEGADYNRYVDYMRNQLRELVTDYGPVGVIRFDGGWTCSDSGLRLSLIDSDGHVDTHTPQPMQRSGITLYSSSSSTIASIGQRSSAHTPHCTQVS